MTHLSTSSTSLFITMQLGERAYDHYLSRKRQLPEIEGSQGAFIALVVSLSVLIVVCCAAVFYLLRHHEPTERDRAIRREWYRRHREERDASSSLPSSLSSLGDKFKQMWRTQSSGGRRGGRGWIQAGSGDEWESDSDHGDPERAGARAQGRQMQAFSTRGVAPFLTDDIPFANAPGTFAIPAFFGLS
ncbi:hypothetical protein PAXINDRAFT_101970 [Paxillus involutus ATCC 200175]|uniref:Uncharacterized protein n=1 Tax=Paxillus involutus ATCC 200175 TaxID=664439 RepID=A0A0C9TIG4_PAXIN|nr:hypothetical protein PAXINDRAFT_101970 [Paxillus involutus ATCC 200175]